MQNAKQGIDVLIPEIKLDVDVSSQDSSFLWKTSTQVGRRLGRALSFRRFVAGIPQPVQEGQKPETAGGRRVAPQMGNG